MPSRPSPIAFSSASPTSSIFKKKKSLSGLSTATSYLSAVSEADARARAHGSTPTSTPALSMSSSVTSSSEDTVLNEGGLDFTDGLSYPKVPPTSEQVFTTVHSEFGHCANDDYRYVSQHRAGTAYKSIPEQDPPYYILLTTYISYIIVICLGHIRDFFGKRFRNANYRHLLPWNVSDSVFIPWCSLCRRVGRCRTTGVCRLELGLRFLLHPPAQAPHRRLLLPPRYWRSGTDNHAP